MKRLLALTILALGIPTLMGSQVQDAKEIKPLNTMTPTDEDGDLCAKSITEYNGAIVVCNEANFKAMRSNNKYVLGTSFSIYNKGDSGTIDHRFSDFQLDGRGNLITLKENTIKGIIENSIVHTGLFKVLSHNTTIKNLRLAQQSLFTYATSDTIYNMYGGIAGRINADRGNILIENVEIEQNLDVAHDNEALIGGIAGDITISNGATMEIKGVKIKTDVNRSQATKQVTDRLGGISGDLFVQTQGTSIKVSNITIDGNHTTVNITTSSSHTGGFFGRVIDDSVTPAIITDKGVVFSDSQINYEAKAGRGAGSADATKMNHVGGVVGTYEAQNANINVNFKNLRADLKLDSHRNAGSINYHNVGGLIGDMVMHDGNSSIVNIDGIQVKGYIKSNGLQYQRIGGIIGRLNGNTGSGSKINIKNIIMEANVLAENSNNRKNGRTIGEVIGTQDYELISVYYTRKSTVIAAYNNDLEEVKVEDDEMDYHFFSGEVRTRQTKAMSLDIDKWEVMPYTQFMDESGNLLLELKWQALAKANPVINDTNKAPTIDVESFRFSDGDRVSPIVWVVGAIIALLTGAFIWYKKRKSAY